jgi:hypothetical protein
MVPPLANDNSVLAPTATVDPTRNILGLVGLGLGAAGFVLGATFGVLAITGDTREDVQEKATIATLAFVAGAGFAVAGGWLLWTSTARGASAVLTPGPGSAMLTARF